VLISTGELAERLGSVVVLDASWHMPHADRDALGEFHGAGGAIPTAAFFDIDAVSDQGSAFPHMLPSGEHFRVATARLGVLDADAEVVVYDSVGMFSAARCWWMMKAFGHKRVRLLDGGLPKWRSEGRLTLPGEDRPANHPCVDTRPSFTLDRSMVMSFEEMIGLDTAAAAAVVDARASARFHGDVAEPRPGLRSGNIPGSFSLPFDSLLDVYEHNGETITRFASPEKIRGAVEAATEGYDGHADAFVTTCGSGVTACVLTAGLEIAGMGASKVYDGSWTEYGSRTPL
jgi:thiosulfate/3-mercaptopyruvate sulfurtransferase